MTVTKLLLETGRTTCCSGPAVWTSERAERLVCSACTQAVEALVGRAWTGQPGRLAWVVVPIARVVAP